MTENKRFTFKDGYLFDDVKGTAFLTVGDCCELLNELHDENKELTLECRRMAKFMMSKGYNINNYLDFCKEYNDD